MNSILTTPEVRYLIAAFTVHGEPISKARARFSKRGSKVVAYTPQKTLDGEVAMASAYLKVAEKRDDDHESVYAVHAHFINGTRQRRDVDNMVKLILDGLNGVAWPDDNQVTEIAGKKSWSTKDEARTEVFIYRLGSMDRPSLPCLQCGTAFLTYESTSSGPRARKYCSAKCGYEHRAAARMRKCKQCSKEFQARQKPHVANFCSSECAYASQRADVNCTHCGVLFNKQKCHVRATNYCTSECQHLELKARRANSRFKGTCDHCGGGTSRKEYKRCQPCKTLQEQVTGKPKTSIT